MSRTEEKLEHFANDVMADVGEERRALVEALDEELSAAYEKKENEYLTKAYEIIQEALIDIDQKKNENMSRIIMRNRTRRFERRNAIIAGVYEKATLRLKDFKETEAYEGYLIDKVKASAGALGDGDILVKLDYSDRALMETVASATGLEVTVASKKLTLIGGCIVENKATNMIVDNTFSRKLATIRGDFVQQCQLEID